MPTYPPNNSLRSVPGTTTHNYSFVQLANSLRDAIAKSPRAYVVTLVVLTAIYFAVGKFGLTLAFVNASATAIWPPTGIALAALLLFGHRLWPSILLGAFLVNVTTTGAVASSIGIATGNTLEALIGSWLVQLYCNGVRTFNSPRNIIRYVAVAMASTSVSATLGVGSLLLTGLASLTDSSSIWFTWWTGDLISALTVAPFIILWVTQGRLPKFRQLRSLGEVGIFGGILFVIGQIVFNNRLVFSIKQYPLDYLLVLPLSLITLRFGQLGAITASMALAAMAINYTLSNRGVFATGNPNESLLLLQAFIGTVTVMTLILGAIVAERRRAAIALKASEDRLRLLVEGIRNYAVCMLDARGHIVSWNEGAQRLSGYTSKQAIGAHFSLLATLEDVAAGKPEQQLVMAVARGSYEEEGWHRRKNQSKFLTSLLLSPLHNDQGTLQGFAVVIQDITQRKHAEEQIRYHAFHDMLTTLPNRQSLEERLRVALQNAQSDQMIAVLFLDLDRFKDINDSLGHSVGDLLLKEVANRFRSSVRSEDMVARFGGDEFVIVLANLKSADDAAGIAEKILQQLRVPITLGRHTINTSVSIGIALYSRDGVDHHTLIRNADLALYQAKTHGRNRYHFHGSTSVPGSSRKLQPKRNET